MENFELKTIAELRQINFFIPYQQRGYKWTSHNVEMLLNDIKIFLKSEDLFYCLQPLAVIKLDDNKYSVIDGQQRLTTLYLIYKFISDNQQFYNFKYEKDSNDERSSFLKSQIKEKNEETIDFYYISNSYLTIYDWFHKSENKNYKEDFKQLFEEVNKSKKSIQILWYELSSEKDHEVFRDINSGKIQLTNADLIKALLLNGKNALRNKEQIASQFEIIEREMSNNDFWYMFNNSDVELQKGQSRMDFLFNLVGKIDIKDYENDSRSAFFKFSLYGDSELENMWKNVRQKYYKLRDIFENPKTFHYFGYLIYCKENAIQLLEEYDKSKKEEYIIFLKDKIKSKIIHKNIEDYSYGDHKVNLRRLFVLHNIETILFKFENLQKKQDLISNYEHFPFELLYNQTWHIEHIDSQTSNSYEKKEDKIEYIESIEEDYGYLFKNSQEYKEKKNSVKESNYDNGTFKKYFDFTQKQITNDPVKNKNGIGNLVLLDSHTNTSFHNSLFPKKRRIVIVASGLRTQKDDESDIQTTFVPLCTQQIYLKTYNKDTKINLNNWSQADYDYYLADIKEKLKDYLK